MAYADEERCTSDSAHVTIQARSEGDVIPSHITKRVSDSSGARYSVHNEAAQKYQAPAPVVRLPFSSALTLYAIPSTFRVRVLEIKLCTDWSTRNHSIQTCSSSYTGRNELCE